MFFCLLGLINSGHCRELAISEGSSVLQVLYIFQRRPVSWLCCESHDFKTYLTLSQVHNLFLTLCPKDTLDLESLRLVSKLEGKLNLQKTPSSGIWLVHMQIAN